MYSTWECKNSIIQPNQIERCGFEDLGMTVTVGLELGYTEDNYILIVDRF
jgi:hypothetical protein